MGKCGMVLSFTETDWIFGQKITENSDMGSFLDVLNMLGNDALKRNVFGNIMCMYIYM